jgi:phytoene synthase
MAAEGAKRCLDLVITCYAAPFRFVQRPQFVRRCVIDSSSASISRTILQSTMQDSYTHCEALVSADDKDRYLASLFAPPPARQHLHALYAFASEIARVRDAAREPLPGEIRLQWWRDVLAGAGRGEVSANPVAAALLDTVMRCALPQARLIALVDAHGFDLYDDAMPSLADLDAYAERTSGTLFALAAQILGGADTIVAAATPAGIAYAVAQRLCTFPRDLARRQLFVPLDLLAQHGVTREEIEASQNAPGLRGALAALRDHARAAFGRFRAAAPDIPESCAPAFLVAVLVPPLLARLDAAADPFELVEVPQWRRQWVLWRSARRWPQI